MSATTSYWAVHCLDTPGMAQQRSAALPEHLAYVRSCPLSVVLAGPLVAGDGNGPVGSLLIIKDADQAAVEGFVRAAPFARAGIWKQIRVDRFNPVPSPA